MLVPVKEQELSGQND